MNHIRTFTIGLLAIAAVALLLGCSVTHLRTPAGIEFSRSALGTDTTLQRLTATVGDSSVSVDGLNINQSTATIRALETVDKIIDAAKQSP